MSDAYKNLTQISVYKTDKNVLEFNKKLKVASAHFGRIHRKDEYDMNGKKLPDSLIGVVAINYDVEPSVRVEENLSPSQIRFLYESVKEKPENYSFPGNGSKVFGEPDENGFCIARKLYITRTSKMPNGELKKYPWRIKISNGKGKKVIKENGSAYLDGKSYVEEKEVSILLTDYDMFELLDEVVSVIRVWEDTYGPGHEKANKELVSEMYRSFNKK